MYEELATGKLHLAFETWPFSNPVAHQKYARDFESRSEADETGQVRAYKYSNLFGRSGIFETAKYDAAPLLQDALKGHSGQAHFAQEAFDQPELGEWDGSPLCAGGNCSVQILHIAPQGYDEGQVEALVQTLGIPATVAYLGQTAHTDAIWSAVTKGTGMSTRDCSRMCSRKRQLALRSVLFCGLCTLQPPRVKKVTHKSFGSMCSNTLTHARIHMYSIYSLPGALVYSYVPNINQYGISVDDLERAKIPPRLDFKSQPLTKLAWPGVHTNPLHFNINLQIDNSLPIQTIIEMMCLFSIHTISGRVAAKGLAPSPPPEISRNPRGCPSLSFVPFHPPPPVLDVLDEGHTHHAVFILIIFLFKYKFLGPSTK